MRRALSTITLALSLSLAALAQDGAEPEPPAPEQAVAEATREPPLLRAGPMLGWVALRSAAVWVQTERPARVQLRVVPAGRPEAAFLLPERASAEAEDCALTLVVDGLEPGTRYEYELYLDGKRVARPWPLAFGTPPLWQYRTPPPDVTFLAGSCAYVKEAPYDRPNSPYGDSTAIYRTMAGEQADAMLWLGDNVYLREVDYDSPRGIFARYRHDRALADLQPLLAAMQHVATWDDHDYGPNDSDRTYALKDVALTAFRRYWPAPATGLPDVPGVFQRRSFGDVDLFMLDDRYYRDPNGWPAGPDKTYLGRAQLEWLKGALVSSRATWKLIAGGGQFLNPGSRYETLARYPQEQAALLDWIGSRRVEGVVFLSGDRHHSELLKLDRPGGYPLHELTSSPLSSGVHEIHQDNPEFQNNLRVPDTLVMQRNYSVLRFTGPPEERLLTIEVKSESGDQLWERRIERKSLVFPAAPEPR